MLLQANAGARSPRAWAAEQTPEPPAPQLPRRHRIHLVHALGATKRQPSGTATPTGGGYLWTPRLPWLAALEAGGATRGEGTGGALGAPEACAGAHVVPGVLARTMAPGTPLAPVLLSVLAGARPCAGLPGRGAAMVGVLVSGRPSWPSSPDTRTGEMQGLACP